MHETEIQAPATEPQDWTISAFAKVAAGLAVALILCAGMVALLFPGSDRQRLVQASPPVPAQPALQVSPRHDMATFYAQEMTQLHTAGWIDREHGIVHMPIDEAMRKIARDGIPGWPGAPK